MKILIFGRGVIGTQYAWAMEKAGHTVEFYVRPGRTASLGDNINLELYDVRNKILGKLIQENWKITLRENLTPNHDYDLILISVQHYHLDQATEFLKDKLDKALVLIFNNIWDEPTKIFDNLPKEQIVFGFPRAGGGFRDDNTTLKGALFGGVVLGTFNSKPMKKEKTVQKLFENSGFKVELSEDYRSWLFGHFALNASVHLETLTADVPKESRTALMKHTKYWRAVKRNLREIIPVLEARGIEVKNSPDLKVLKMPAIAISMLMRIAIKFFPSVKTLFASHNNDTELRAYIEDVSHTASSLNISAESFERKFANKNKL